MSSVTTLTACGEPFAEIHTPDVCSELQELTSSVQVDLGAAAQQTGTHVFIHTKYDHQ